MSLGVYSKHFNTRQTPQLEPIPGKTQVENSAGGYSFAVDDWTRLDRFLVLGSTGGSYYVSEQKLTRDNAEAVVRCIQEDGRRAVDTIVAVSWEGRAPKNSPAIFALALAASLGNRDTRCLAFQAMPEVCRTGTHLFEFVEAAEGLRGWGRKMREGVANWYLRHEAESTETGGDSASSTDNRAEPEEGWVVRNARDLAYQIVKYQQRGSWSHRDLLRLSHPKARTSAVNAVLEYAAKGWSGVLDDTPPTDPSLEPIWAFERAKRATSANEIVRLIRDHGLVRECIPTQFLNTPEVWDALLERMPLTAMVRNLAKMTAVGLIRPLSQASRKVIAVLENEEAIRKARLHPLAILTAMKVYEQGKGDRGQLAWSPDFQIVNALDAAFYQAFRAVEPTGKNWLLALDVSGSMDWGKIAGSPFTPRVASAAMALVTANVEKNHHVCGFTSGWGISPLNISPCQRLDDVVRYIGTVPAGGTDCSLPMQYALNNKMEVDAFVVFTDSETWTGQVHPCQALRLYREVMGRSARLIVVGMQSNNFSIADPDDGGTLDIVGFDVSAPGVMADFVRS